MKDNKLIFVQKGVEIKKAAILFGSMVFAFLLMNCASAPHTIVDQDVASDWSGNAYDDLLIIGAYDDRPIRVSLESSFADALKGKGIPAAPSYDLIPDLTEIDSEDDIAKVFGTTSHDGVLVIGTLDEGYDYDVGDYYATRGMVYLLGGEPGAGTDAGALIAWAGSGVYSLYVGLWDAKTAKQVWQITTDSERSGSEAEDIAALADFVTDILRGKGMVKPASGAN